VKPAATQIASTAKEYQYFNIYCFPSIDALLASSIIINYLVREKIDFSLEITPRLEATEKEPSILIGYPAELAKETTFEKPSVLLTRGSRQQQNLQKLVVVSGGQSSTATVLTATLSEITVVGYMALYAIVSSLWVGVEKDEKGALKGIEDSIIELLKLENLVEDPMGVRLFRWKQLPTEKSIYITLEPYLPHLTGNTEKIPKFLEEKRLSTLVGRKMDEVDNEKMVAFGEKLYEYLKQKSRIRRRPVEVVGTLYYSEAAPLPDLREAGYILAYFAENTGADRLIGLGVDDKLVTAVANYRYRKDFTRIISAVEEYVDKKLEPTKLAGIETVKIEHELPLLIARKVLESLGIVEKQHLLVGSDNKVVVEEVLVKYGYKKLREMLDSKCLEYSEWTIHAELREQRCR